MLEFKLEDFFPIYEKTDEDIVDENLSGVYQSIIFKKEFDDARSILNEPRPARGEQLKHQAFMVRFMSPYTPYDKMLAFHGVGSGKCLAEDTPVLMYDGSIKKVQDIKLGDLVMGDNSTSRRVLSVCEGEDQLYDVIPIKGEKYTVNSKHVLTLKISNSGIRDVTKSQPNKPFQAIWIDKNTLKKKSLGFPTREEAEKYLNNFKEDDKIVDIEVEDYLKLPEGIRDQLKGIRTGVNFKDKKVMIDPYIIGYWLGDGTSRDPVITTIEQEVIDYYNEELKKYNLHMVKLQDKYGYRVTNIYKEGESKTKKNYFKDTLSYYDLLNNKHIPIDYKINSREIRLKLLAGLIDSDGYLYSKSCYEITQKNKVLADDILYLCRSLGFAAYMKECKKSCIWKGEKREGTYYRITFSGEGVEEIPCVVPRKKSDKREQVKDVLVSGIKVEPSRVGKYYGFMLDGNCRFLLGDFTITHNSCMLTAIAEYAKYVRAGELSNNKVIVLTRNPTLRKGLINEIACVCTAGKYEPPVRDEKTKELLSKDTQRRRVERNISVEYEVLTFTMFVKEIYNKSNQQLKDEYSNRYILIDEAHNIRLQPAKKKADEDSIMGIQLSSRGISNYKEIHRFLHTVVGCKVLLLTGTPMRDQPSEICQILNLILPLDKQLNKKEFNKTYFEGSKFNESLKEEFKSLIRNTVSYVRTSLSDINVKNEGDVDIDRRFKFTKTVRLDMEVEQERKYKEAYKKDSKKYKELSADDEVGEEEEEEEESGKGLWINSRHVSMFSPIDNDEKLNSLIERDGNTFKPSQKLINYLTQNGDDVDNMLLQLKKNSIKFWFIVREVLRNPTQKFFIYSNIVKGAGCLLLGAILQVFGMVHAPNIKGSEGTKYCPEPKGEINVPLTKNNNRLLVLTGSTLSANQIDIMINDIFNNKSNIYGDYIRVIIGSHIVGEGITFKHIRKMFVLTPGWNNSTTEQAIARAVRFKSHDDLPEKDRNISIYRLAAEPSIDPSEKGLDSIDMQMYKLSEDKDVRIKQVERLMKETAVDCALNRSRNLLPTDKPNSKECDYMQCAYECDLVDERYYHANWVGDRIVDTYNLYYAYKEINIVKNAVKEIFMYKFAYDFEEMYTRLNVQSIPAIVLARALDSMINNNEEVINKYGFVNYLREDKNMFFLVDDPLSPPIFTSYYYSAHPVPENSLDSYENLLSYFQYDKINNVLEVIIENQNDVKVLDRVFSNLNVSVTQKVIEIFFIAKLKKSNINKELQDYIIDKYNMYISKVGSKYVLNIIPTNLRVLHKDKWVDLTEEEQEEMKKMKEQKVETLRSNKYGIYAVISDTYKGKEEHKNLKLVELGEKKSFGGTSCSTNPFGLSTLIGLYYKIMKKSLEEDIEPPVLGDRSYTLNKVKTFKLFKNVKETIISTLYVNTLKDVLTDLDDLKEFVDKLQASKDKKKLLKILDRNILEEEDFINFIKVAEPYKEKLIENFMNMSETKFNSFIERKAEEEINSLTEEEINYLGNMLNNKSAAEICGSLKEWFINNDLYMYEGE